jgi:hypothetical protein
MARKPICSGGPRGCQVIDLIYIAIGIAFFGISIWYVRGCDALLKGAGDE